MPHSTTSPSEQPPEWLHGKELHVNDGPLPPSMVLPLLPTPLSTPLSEMHARYNRDGYVYIKGLIPRADVLSARAAYFSMLSPSGVLKPSTTPEQGIFDPARDPLDFPGIGAGGVATNGRPSGPHPEVADQFVDLALQAHWARWYTEFCAHPALLEFVAKFTGWGEENTGAVRRTLIRNNTPGNKAIGVHYDQIFLRHGEDSVLTAWVPMGDIKVEGGGLIYLENGHTLGAEIEQDFTRKARESGMTDDEARFAFNQNMTSGGMLTNGPIGFAQQHNRRWLVTPYEAGDVVLHNAYAIHASTMNFDDDGVIRVGTDLRFVDKRRPWDQRWDKDFTFNDGL